ncbi:hypothetical protein BJ973_007223 [Actinoplanes tereljensis]|uniref:Uncharacterized protein n=1 Tax=Paractinoplanes tereljensis TaxID=571912 RepID=A0A919TY69_9ACTN|nr:hypothetical protein [Actinoplanes tereljensis]GIF24965.1 hypothetical protein Ate02nite_76950 [Actinoplanes tereljensis]
MSEAARAALIDRAASPSPTPTPTPTPTSTSAQPAVAEAGPAPDKPGRRRFLFFGKRSAPVAAPQIPAQVTNPPVGALAAAAGLNGIAAAPSDVAAAPGVKLKEPLPSDRPAHAPPDPWKAFASTAERPPGRIRRGIRAVGRGLIHEYAVVTYLALAIAVALTWPTLQYPLHTLPQDLGDPARQAWQIAWSGHILLTDPVQLWQSNAFFNQPNSFAYGDSLLGYAPAGMLGEGPLAATLRYNILFVLAHALLLIGSYALVRQLGAGRTGAAVAAVAFASAPWRLAQEGHLDIISAGGIPLALAMLARGHGWSMRRGFRRKHRNAGWAAAGWLVAAWQVSLGFSLGLPFLGVLGLILLVLLVRVPIRWFRRPTERPVLGWRLLVADVLGPLIVAGIAALIAIPYFKGSGTATATAEIKFFSPPLRSLLIGPAESRVWSGAHAVPRSSLTWPAEMSLLPGFVLYALALAGLAFSIWTLWQRLFLLAGLATTIILTLGTNFFDGKWTYLPLFGHLPASLGTRIPGRLMLWVTLLLAVLAAGAVAEFVRRADHWAESRIPPWPGPWLRTATLIPLALVLVEGWNSTAHPVVPDQPAAMRTVTGPMLVLPTAELTDQMTMLWSTTRFQEIANGSGGFAAGRQADLRRNATTFPDQASVDYLRGQGITTVLLLRDYVAGTPWERAGDTPVDSLGITREDLDDAVLFRLSQPSTQPTDPAQPGQGTSPTQPPGQGTFPTQPGQDLFPTQPDQITPGQTFPTQPIQPTVQAQALAR